jgi:hypothetical protein
MQAAMRAPIKRAALAAVLGSGLLALGPLLSGCSHYVLGTDGRLAFSTLYVEPVENRALIPQAQAIVTAQLRDAFEKDGRVTLVNSPEAADATLTVVITDYHREVAAVREADTGLASKFNLTLAVVCALTDNRAHRAYFQGRPIYATREAFTDNGVPASTGVGNQLQSEYNTLPLLAQQLADKISHAVLDVW